LLRGTFRKNDIAALLLRFKPRHVEKFRECRLTDVGESELTDEKEETMRKTYDRVRRIVHGLLGVHMHPRHSLTSLVCCYVLGLPHHENDVNME